MNMEHNRHMKESTWLVDCKTGYRIMSALEQIKAWKRLGGYTKSPSSKLGHGNCRRKQASQNKPKVESKVRHKSSKAFSGNNEHSRTGRNVHNIEQVTTEVTRQTAQQKHAGSRLHVTVVPRSRGCLKAEDHIANII